MGSIAQIKDGEVVQNNATSALTDKTSTNKNSTLGKDAFLGMLVAQMKYQDPLEPTSNTEFISQYATFSELEQMQNVSASLDLTRGSSLVGKIVSVNAINSKGEIVQFQGKVDYVKYENNKAYVSIGGALYALDDVVAIADQDYLDAYDLAYEFAVGMNKMPGKEHLTLNEKEALDKLNKMYKDMTDYQKTFISKDYVSQLEELTKRMEELVKEQEENNKPPTTGDGDGDPGDGEGTGDTEKPKE